MQTFQQKITWTVGTPTVPGHYLVLRYPPGEATFVYVITIQENNIFHYNSTDEFLGPIYAWAKYTIMEFTTKEDNFLHKLSSMLKNFLRKACGKN